MDHCGIPFSINLPVAASLKMIAVFVLSNPDELDCCKPVTWLIVFLFCHLMSLIWSDMNSHIYRLIRLSCLWDLLVLLWTCPSISKKSEILKLCLKGSRTSIGGTEKQDQFRDHGRNDGGCSHDHLSAVSVSLTSPCLELPTLLFSMICSTKAYIVHLESFGDDCILGSCKKSQFSGTRNTA